MTGSLFTEARSVTICFYGVTSHTVAVWLAYVDTGYTATYVCNSQLELHARTLIKTISKGL